MAQESTTLKSFKRNLHSYPAPLPHPSIKPSITMIRITRLLTNHNIIDWCALQVKIWFQNRRMKWKRSKKAHQEAKHGSSAKDSSRSNTSRSRSPHNHHHHQSSEDEKSSSGSGKPVTEKGYSNSADLPPLTTQPPPPPAMAQQHSTHPPPPPSRHYGSSGGSNSGNGMEFSSAGEMEKHQHEHQKFENNNGGASLLMKRTPLFFPEDVVNGEMFRPYVS